MTEEEAASAIDTRDARRPRPDPLATLDAIRRLDLQLEDCDGPIARGILRRALQYLEADLLVQLSGLGRGGRPRVTGTGA